MNLCVLIISAAAMLAQDRPEQAGELPSLDARWHELLALDDRWNASRFRAGEKQFAGAEDADAAVERSDAIFTETRELAQRYAADLDLEQLSGEDRFKALDIHMMRWQRYNEIGPLMRLWHDPPASFQRRAAYWRVMQVEVVAAETHEKTARLFGSFYPDHVQSRVSILQRAGKAFRESGRPEKGEKIMREAFELAVSAPARITGGARNLSPKAISPLFLARLVCETVACSETQRGEVMQSLKARLERHPDVIKVVDEKWPWYDMIGRPLPRISGTAHDGTPIDTDKLRGKIIIIEFTASWCGPCQNEIPHLRELHKTMPAEIAIISISADKDRQAMMKWIVEKKMNWPFLGGESGFDEPVFKQFGVGGIPSAIVVDREGVVRWRGGAAYFLRDRLQRILNPSREAGVSP